MINIIYDLIKSGIGFFTKKQIIEKEIEKTNAEGQIEVNKIEIERVVLHWRNLLGMVLVLILFSAYFGIFSIDLPLEPIFKLLMILVGAPV